MSTIYMQEVRSDRPANQNGLDFVDLLKGRAIFLLMATIVISIFGSISFEQFGNVDNFKSILLNVSTTAIVAVGMMILLISGVFDLSVGAVFGLAGAIAANLMFYHDVHWIPSVLVAIIVSLLIGLVNGMLIAKIRVNPLIVTLAMLGLIRGVIRIIAGSGIIDLPDGFLMIADVQIWGFRIPILYLVMVVILFAFLVHRTSFFRKYFYIGANEEAANLSGINIVKMRVISFMLVSGLSGIAGIIYTSRLTMAMETVGVGLEMQVLTACFLGGASLSGGKGSVFGAVMGTIFVGLIANIIVISRINSYWINIVIYTTLLITVTMDVMINELNLKIPKSTRDFLFRT
jgi:ribose transport system permease protein